MVIYELKGKLRKANVIAHHTHKPVILYRDTIEETSCASEEEVCLLAEDHIIFLLYAMVVLFLLSFNKLGFTQ